MTELLTLRRALRRNRGAIARTMTAAAALAMAGCGSTPLTDSYVESTKQVSVEFFGDPDKYRDIFTQEIINYAEGKKSFTGTGDKAGDRKQFGQLGIITVDSLCDRYFEYTQNKVMVAQYGRNTFNTGAAAAVAAMGLAQVASTTLGFFGVGQTLVNGGFDNYTDLMFLLPDMASLKNEVKAAQKPILEEIKTQMENNDATFYEMRAKIAAYAQPCTIIGIRGLYEARANGGDVARNALFEQQKMVLLMEVTRLAEFPVSTVEEAKYLRRFLTGGAEPGNQEPLSNFLTGTGNAARRMQLMDNQRKLPILNLLMAVQVASVSTKGKSEPDFWKISQAAPPQPTALAQAAPAPTTPPQPAARPTGAAPTPSGSSVASPALQRRLSETGSALGAAPLTPRQAAALHWAMNGDGLPVAQEKLKTELPAPLWRAATGRLPRSEQDTVRDRLKILATYPEVDVALLQLRTE